MTYNGLSHRFFRGNMAKLLLENAYFHILYSDMTYFYVIKGKSIAVEHSYIHSRYGMLLFNKNKESIVCTPSIYLFQRRLQK
jgi:hypothetical protein